MTDWTTRFLQKLTVATLGFVLGVHDLHRQLGSFRLETRVVDLLTHPGLFLILLILYILVEQLPPDTTDRCSCP